VLKDTLQDHLVGGLVLHFPLILTTLAVALSVELTFGEVFKLRVEVHHGVLENGHFSVWDTVLQAVIIGLSLYLRFFKMVT